MNWRNYLDLRLIPRNLQLKKRDRVPVVCPQCGRCTIVYIFNLEKRIKKYGDYKCRSCAAKYAAKHGKRV